MDPISAHSFRWKSMELLKRSSARPRDRFENAIIEYQQQAPRCDLHPQDSGTLKWENISLKRGITTNAELWKWRQQVIDGQMRRPA